MSKTMIITDTCSDLPVELSDKYDVEILATTFLIDGMCFSETIDFSHENFYDILATEHDKVKNFYIPAAVYLDRYKSAATRGFENVLVIMAGTEMFPMHKSAREAVTFFRDQNPTSDLRIEIIDTLNYSMSAGLLVLEAARLSQEGVDFDELLATIKNDVAKMKLIVDAFYIPHSFNDPARQWKKWISLKSYHPYPTLKIGANKADELPIIKGDHSAFDQFYTYCIESLSEKKPEYAIGYAARVKEARALALLLEEELGYPPIALYKLGAISVYGASRAAIALCFKED